MLNHPFQHWLIGNSFSSGNSFWCCKSTEKKRNFLLLFIEVKEKTSSKALSSNIHSFTYATLTAPSISYIPSMCPAAHKHSPFLNISLSLMMFTCLVLITKVSLPCIIYPAVTEILYHYHLLFPPTPHCHTHKHTHTHAHTSGSFHNEALGATLHENR